MCLIADDEALNALVAKLGKENGYDDAGAEFAGFKDFKIRWSRTCDWIRMEVSDYLRNTEEGIVEGILRTLFGKIRGNDDEYPGEAVEYLESHEFVEKNQSSYIQRTRGIAADDSGILEESMKRLRKRRLVRNDADLKVFWDSSRNDRIGTASPLMKVATVNARLKDADENVLDFAVYSQVTHIQMGFNPRSRERAKEYGALLDKYKGRADAEKSLESLGMAL